jgi:hypothetical protein
MVRPFCRSESVGGDRESQPTGAPVAVAPSTPDVCPLLKQNAWGAKLTGPLGLNNRLGFES